MYHRLMRTHQPTDEELRWWAEGARLRTAGRPKPAYPEQCSEREEARYWWMRQGWDGWRPSETLLLDEEDAD